MDGLAIQTQELTKVFHGKSGKITAVDALNLRVGVGEIFGLLGPNGAGKTTTVRMLCGLIRPTSGSAVIDGLNVASHSGAVRGRIGLVPEDAGDHRNLSLREELEYYGALYGLDRQTVRQRSDPLIERLGLGDRVKDRLHAFSKGMRRKFHLIRALLHEPRILLLDEPTAGLDPAVVVEVWELLKSLAAEHHVTVILCSHHLEEVEKLCDRVAIMKQRLLVEGSLSELSGGRRRYHVELAADAAGFLQTLQAIDGVEQATAQNNRLRFALCGEPPQILPRLVRTLVESGAPILQVTTETRDLRSLYLSTVGETSGIAGGGK